MPCRDQVEGGVGGREPAGVQDTDQAAVGGEEVPGGQIAVRHPIGPVLRCRAQAAPQPSQRPDVDEVLTLRQARLDPVVVCAQRAPSTTSGEPATSRRRGPQRRDEHGEVGGNRPSTSPA